ncbi:unnamed protein product [Amoebophrya sp. A120]|nr:unnamed protein product [Amoebophrya sp. A120]|eukprot:GSA120T00004549001.1
MKILFACRTDTIGTLLENCGDFEKAQSLKKSKELAVRNILKKLVITEVAAELLLLPGSSSNGGGSSSQKSMELRLVTYTKEDILEKIQYHEDLLEEDMEEEELPPQMKSVGTAQGNKASKKPDFEQIIHNDKCLSAVFEAIAALTYHRADDTETENTFFVWEPRDVGEHLRLEVKRAVHSANLRQSGKTTTQSVRQGDENEYLEKIILQRILDCESLDVVNVQKLLAEKNRMEQSDGGGRKKIEFRSLDDVFSKDVVPELEKGIKQGKFKNIDDSVGNLLCKYHGSIYGVETQKDAGTENSSASTFYDGMVAGAANLRDSVNALKNLDLDSASQKIEQMKEILRADIIPPGSSSAST